LIRRRVLWAALLVLPFGLGWWAGRGGASSDLYSNLDVFVEVIHKVQDNYVDPVDATKLIDGALKGMLASLDPYSQFMDRHAFQNLVAVTDGHYGGVGLMVTVRDRWPSVISPIEGGSAWEAGVRPGDVIVEIDGKSSAGLSLDEVADRLRGDAGTRVRLGVRAEGEDSTRTFVLERRDIVTRSVPYAFLLDRGVGYVRLSNFSETSGSEVRAAVARLAGEGAHSLILDLRGNPGGVLEQAVNVSEQFLPKGALVVSKRGRAAGQDARYYASGTRPNLDWPMAVLVDAGSASASEIVAGALQDLDRAVLVGQTSFGKGSVQKVYPLVGGTEALKLTTALYYTPSGRSIHKLHGAALAAADDSGEEDDNPDADTVAVAPAAPARPRFHTAAGRVVYGGGGVTPDAEVPVDSLPPLVLDLERGALPFRFANRWSNAHPNAPEDAGTKAPRTAKGSAAATAWDAPLAPAVWSGFVAFVHAERPVVSQAALEAERPRLERAVRRELARRTAGDAAAARVAFEKDPVVRRALDALTKARAPRDVFVAARPSKAESATP